MIREQLKPVFFMFIFLTVITGLVYPLLVTGTAQVFFKHQANGSLIYQDGKVVGSTLLGRPVEDPKYFWGRPSATGPSAYNAASSSGSNYGPMNADYLKAVEARVQALRDADPGSDQPVPVDLVTASGSGLDPHITPAGARYQVPRIAKLRQMDKSVLNSMIDSVLEKPQWGFLGESRVNVMKLNLLLDSERS